LRRPGRCPKDSRSSGAAALYGLGYAFALVRIDQCGSVACQEDVPGRDPGACQTHSEPSAQPPLWEVFATCGFDQAAMRHAVYNPSSSRVAREPSDRLGPTPMPTPTFAHPVPSGKIQPYPGNAFQGFSSQRMMYGVSNELGR